MSLCHTHSRFVMSHCHVIMSLTTCHTECHCVIYIFTYQIRRIMDNIYVKRMIHTYAQRSNSIVISITKQS